MDLGEVPERGVKVAVALGAAICSAPAGTMNLSVIFVPYDNKPAQSSSWKTWGGRKEGRPAKFTTMVVSVGSRVRVVGIGVFLNDKDTAAAASASWAEAKPRSKYPLKGRKSMKPDDKKALVAKERIALSAYGKRFPYCTQSPYTMELLGRAIVLSCTGCVRAKCWAKSLGGTYLAEGVEELPEERCRFFPGGRLTDAGNWLESQALGGGGVSLCITVIYPSINSKK